MTRNVKCQRWYKNHLQANFNKNLFLSVAESKSIYNIIVKNKY